MLDIGPGVAYWSQVVMVDVAIVAILVFHADFQTLRKEIICFCRLSLFLGLASIRWRLHIMLTSLWIGSRRKRCMPRESEGSCVHRLLPDALGHWADYVQDRGAYRNVFLGYNRPLKLHLVLHLMIQHRIFMVNYQC